MKEYRCSMSQTYLIGPTLNTRNTTTTMRHTALLFGAVAFSTVFCRKKSGNTLQHNVRTADIDRMNSVPFRACCSTATLCTHLYRSLKTQVTLGLPHSADPPAASWGCHSRSWAPRSQSVPLSGELPEKLGTLSSFYGRAMPTLGSLSCAAASGTTLTKVRAQQANYSLQNTEFILHLWKHVQ